MASWLGRGLRSGVGIAGFDHGGLLVDGGPGADGAPAPLLARAALPRGWRIVVVQDERARGLSGPDERAAIAALPPLPQAQAADICHQVLMRVLPGAAEAQFAALRGRRQSRAASAGRSLRAGPTGEPLDQPGDRSPDAVVAGIGGRWRRDRPELLGPHRLCDRAVGRGGAGVSIEAAQSAGVVDAALGLRIVAGRNHGAVIDLHAPTLNRPLASREH